MKSQIFINYQSIILIPIPAFSSISDFKVLKKCSDFQFFLLYKKKRKGRKTEKCLSTFLLPRAAIQPAKMKHLQPRQGLWDLLRMAAGSGSIQSVLHPFEPDWSCAMFSLVYISRWSGRETRSWLTPRLTPISSSPWTIISSSNKPAWPTQATTPAWPRTL